MSRSIAQVHVVDASPATIETRPRPLARGYTCPVCGGNDPTEEAHNKEGDCSKLAAGAPRVEHRLPIFKAWRGQEVTSGDWMYQQTLERRKSAGRLAP